MGNIESLEKRSRARTADNLFLAALPDVATSTSTTSTSTNINDDINDDINDNVDIDDVADGINNYDDINFYNGVGGRHVAASFMGVSVCLVVGCSVAPLL